MIASCTDYYDRLVTNLFLFKLIFRGLSESQHLQKIHINETFPELSMQKQEAEMKKHQLAASKTSIGFDYGDDGGASAVTGPTEEESDEGTKYSQCFIFVVDNFDFVHRI